MVPRSSSSTPSLSIGDVSVNEGQSGSTNATFTVALSAASSQTVTVNYATANGTATAGSDYTAASGTLTFTAGQTSKTVTVPVAGDTAIESNETFTVNLTGPTNATLADGQAVGTILNDDFPTLSIGDVTVNEGNSGTTNADVHRDPLRGERLDRHRQLRHRQRHGHGGQRLRRPDRQPQLHRRARPARRSPSPSTATRRWSRTRPSSST